ncbi:MAG: AbrB/MazE/SpoVT family DNA-binding domain-containing protein [Clostridiales bacterium]|nr:AbrB/MazE/SpoVT family DNA-binding domain-containing protein [Clostridiales bacterium]
MKATGIVRRVDDLGRIVIPKEIRKTLKVKEGMSLEIYTDQDGGIVLKKYLPFSEFSALAEEYAECMVQQSGGLTAIITDREKIVAAAGNSGRSLKGKAISARLERILDDRDEQLPASERNRHIPLTESMDAAGAQVYSLIRSGGEILGSVFLQAKEVGRPLGELEKRVTAIAADFLGRQVSG